jgi:hypothetical protein
MTALAYPGGPFLAWLPAAPPAVVTSSIWGEDRPPVGSAPEIEPEHLRLFTYTALGAGYRGIGFRGNADLTRDAGRPLLIEMAFLNEEIDLCEAILANSSDPIPLLDTHDPDPPTLPPPGSRVNQRLPVIKERGPHPGVQAAAINTRDHKGTLLLVADYSPSAQFVPPQMAANNLHITVMAPESAQAFEISPGDIHALTRERVPGGIRIVLPEFGPTALVLITTDLGIEERLRAAISRVRPLAVQMAIEQAELEYQRVAATNAKLVKLGMKLYDKTDMKSPPLPEGAPEPAVEADLLKLCEAAIKAARELLEREDYPLAWSEARRATRNLRHLMFAQWSKAFENVVKAVGPPEIKRDPQKRGRMSNKEHMEIEYAKRNRTPYLMSPVLCPPLVSYPTLPQYDYWVHWMSKPFGHNRVPSGNFEDRAALETAGWINSSYEHDGITAKVMNTVDPKDKNNHILKMRVLPTEKQRIDKFVPHFEFPAAAIRSPAIRMEPDELFRISVMVTRPLPSVAGSGGIIVSDSIGGEALQYRSSASITKPSKIILYRRAPSHGVFTVTLGLAGFGEATFDDFRVETVDESRSGGEGDFAGRTPTRPRAPAPAAAGAPSTATRTGPRFRTR